MTAAGLLTVGKREGEGKKERERGGQLSFMEEEKSKPRTRVMSRCAGLGMLKCADRGVARREQRWSSAMMNSDEEGGREGGEEREC